MKVNNESVYELVLDQTKGLLNQYGIKGWSMDRLAKQSGVAKNTLYKIIQSKENAVYQVIVRDMEYINGELVKVIRANMAKVDTNELIDLFATLFGKMHGPYLQEFFLEYPTSMLDIKSRVDRIEGLVLQLIEAMKEEGILRPDCEGAIVYEALRGMSIEFIQQGYSGEQFANRIRKSFRYLVEGIRNPQ